jgi:Uma2 family endonuclease
MNTLEEIRAALRRLSYQERLSVELCLQELDGMRPPELRVEEARPAYGASDPSFMTLEEYLEFEENSPLKHEFINGVLFAMSGPSVAHARITRNLTIAIGTHLKGGPCDVFASDVRVTICRDVNEIAYYPDVIVDCRPDTRDTHFVRDPKLIVEVLSPSTQHIDRREKLQNYRLIGSVEEYVIVSQDERRLIVYPRAEGWTPRVYGALQPMVELRSIDLTLPLNELYRDAEVS